MSLDKPKAVVLLSGGLDSTTVLAIAQRNGFETYALSFSYGQTHSLELDAAKKVAERFGVREHRIFKLDLGSFLGSALVGDGEIPKHDSFEDLDADLKDEIPSTYVPARNTVFLSIALAWAEVISAKAIFIGVNALDYSGYPDCRPEYIKAYEKMANLATKAGVNEPERLVIHAPLIDMSKAEIIRLGISLGVDYSITHSCYDPTPDQKACGRCDSCLLRLRGFEEAGLVDPASL